MTRDDIIKLAREAGLVRTGDGWTEPHRWGMAEIERFAALVAEAEREECAKMIESTDLGAFRDDPSSQKWFAKFLMGFAKVIRARE